MHARSPRQSRVKRATGRTGRATRACSSRRGSCARCRARCRSSTRGARPRHQGPHEGVDLMAAAGTPDVAVVSGNVDFKSGGMSGLGAYLSGDDGNLYYYFHLSAYEGAPRHVAQGERDRLRRQHRRRPVHRVAHPLRDPPGRRRGRQPLPPVAGLLIAAVVLARVVGSSADRPCRVPMRAVTAVRRPATTDDAEDRGGCEHDAIRRGPGPTGGRRRGRRPPTRRRRRRRRAPSSGTNGR